MPLNMSQASICAVLEVMASYCSLFDAAVMERRFFDKLVKSK